MSARVLCSRDAAEGIGHDPLQGAPAHPAHRPGCCRRSTRRRPSPARTPRPGRAPTRGRRSPRSSRSTCRGPASSRCQAATRSRAGSAGPSPPTSRTPARRPPDTSTLPGIRSPWVITSRRRCAADHAARPQPTQPVHVQELLRCARSRSPSTRRGIGRSPPRPVPANVRPRVSMARTSWMNSARSCANADRLARVLIGGGGSRAARSAPTTAAGSPGPVRRARPARGWGTGCGPAARARPPPRR